jgi:hypothetical protein
MDPLSSIFAAVVAGSTVALQSTISDLVKDAYAGIKRIISDRYTSVDLQRIERDPAAPENRSALDRQLRESGAAHDTDLLLQANALLDEVARSRPDLAAVIGVDLAGIRAGTVRIDDIVSAGSGVRIKDAIAGGDFVISNVRAGASTSSGKA